MRGLKLQFSNALLMVLTVAVVISAVINFQQQGKFRLPDDGVTWSERNGAVQALYIAPGSPAANVGIRPGDALLKIAGASIDKATDVSRVLVRLGSWNKAAYRLRRNGVEFETTLVVGQGYRNYPAYYYQYTVGLAYLGIGLFVFFRRGAAPKALHFYVLCLASFVLSTFHYTGKLNDFDKVMYFGNVAAGLFAPTIFVHFCLAFPERGGWFKRRVRGCARLPARHATLGAIPGLQFGPAGRGHSGHRTRLAARPRLDGLPDGHVPVRRVRPEPRLPARRRPHRAAADQVAAERRGRRSGPVRGVLRGSLPARRGARHRGWTWRCFRCCWCR